MTSSRRRRGNRLRRGLSAASALVANGLVYPLSGLAPRRRDLWLFGHQDGSFAGNPKHLFLWLREHRPDLRAVWVAQDEATADRLREAGYPVCIQGSPGWARLCLRAGAHFFSHGPEDVGLPLSRGALLVSLWHGVGLKSLRLGNPASPTYRYSRPGTGRLQRIRNLGPLLNPDVLVTTSQFMRDHFSTQFGMPPEKCPMLGYPRLDAPLDAKLGEALARFSGCEPDALWSDGVAEVYAYVPTFRDTGRAFLGQAIPDRDRLEAVLEARNAVLYLRLHRKSGVAEWQDSPRIRVWPKGVDLDASLPSLSGLITDYSSVHYDYIFHRDRGSILYMFDREKYLAADRDLLYPLDENTAGWRADHFEELVDLIASGQALQPHPDVARVRAKFWGTASGPASPRVVEHVERLLAEPAPTS